MKRLAAILAVSGLVFPFAAQAQDAKAGEGAVKAAGCLKCHSVSAEKDGPSYKAVAAKYKGQADAQAKLAKFIAGHQGGAKMGDKSKDAAAYILAL
jgi:cytochrome c